MRFELDSIDSEFVSPKEVLEEQAMDIKENYDLVPVDSIDVDDDPYLKLSDEEFKVIDMVRQGKSLFSISKALGKKKPGSIYSLIGKEHVGRILKEIDAENSVLLNGNTGFAIETLNDLMRNSEKDEVKLAAAKVFVTRHEKKEEVKAKVDAIQEGNSSTPVKDFMRQVIDAAVKSREGVTFNVQNNISYNGDGA